ncbi:hypothetical protein [Bradyrhizobium canariense]|uniref:DUF3828 domain-containing protein n=1 Tax=Bradyrhizobium canariense TaxID=255045 RepID=A0A1X3H197_9BRAD|nr:hypothetical protein [Bradyrhizobium canariense]OSI66309.1 hypothetical protein BSZ22_27685 [Bradyrhizobium canariense]OSI77697.1 hypothetical protein BSZ23_20475 [Bradyrhizobium canariense]OSI86667.1 hypothetical protein BSZ24_28365 [Bradyrhizobium canariense]OSI88854.1 hypothetical protein BSZ25_21945 [Bradyrhizobium canariense]OSJ01308.1 hypothetical protein BSZ16_19365 [Bradyrhizobium canariense]
MRELAGIAALLAGFWPAAAQAGFRTPESVVRNVYAHYGQGAPELSKGLPQDGATARQFFDPSLRKVWSARRVEPYDFLVQSPSWKLGPVAIAVVRRQYDKTYVAANFDNRGRPVTLNFILVSGPKGWLITDVESPHDSLRTFLEQFRN